LTQRARKIALEGDKGDLAALTAMMGHRSYSKGEFDSSVALLRQALSLYDDDNHRDHAAKYGHDTKVFALSTLSSVFVPMGLIEQAKQAIRNALDWADELKSAQSSAMAMSYELAIYHYLGDAAELSIRADKLIEYANRFDLPNWLLPAQLLGAWSRGDREAAERGVQILDQLGVGQFACLWNYPIAQLEFEQGLFEQAFKRLSKYIDWSLEIQELFYLPELYRLRALCRLNINPSETDGIVSDLDTAVERAKMSGAKLLQMRAMNALLSISLPLPLSKRAVIARQAKQLAEWLRHEPEFMESVRS
jgi:tetratricopeptide (TPR) repeat protein